MKSATNPAFSQSIPLQKTLYRVYTVLMAITLVGYVYLLLYGVGFGKMPIVFWLLRVLTAVMAICLGKLWKDRLFLLLAVYLGYMFFRILFVSPDQLFTMEGAENLLSGLWLCTACYGLATILNEIELKRFLRFVIAVWTVGIVVDCTVGIYVSWTDQAIQGLGTGMWFVENGRLNMLVLPTVVGGILVISLMLIFIMVLVEKSIVTKILYTLTSLILLLTLALTDSRTGALSLAVGVGAMAGIGTYRFSMRRGIHGILFWLIVVLVMCVGSVLSFLAVHSLSSIFNSVKIQGGLLIADVFAETSEQTRQMFITRSYFSTREVLLTGRTELWQSILAYLKENPLTLFFGNSVVFPLRGVTDFYAHCHNMPLQLTMEDGLIGCLPLWVFLGIIMIRSFRVIKRETLWLALLPAVVLSQWVGEMAETYTWFRSSQCIMSPVLFICMGIISVEGKKHEHRECGGFNDSSLIKISE